MLGLAPYVTETDYTARFYPETAPGHIAFALAAAGQDPGRSRSPARVLELGCGRGFGLALLAAANPDVLFEGYDFNPRQVADAQRFGRDAGLDISRSRSHLSPTWRHGAGHGTSISPSCTALWPGSTSRRGRP